ncbi:MAG TPA: SDR family NAD(P)-dependent oxidoreductase [Usitatibacter sp.]|nr:SDR family NAD(P)-dependent oxidoreductase [Usitatibacter sp.]
MPASNLFVVTGTTRGLGHALAARIARDPANELVALARAATGPAEGGWRIEADMADTAALERACDALEQRIAGREYARAVLINNAGIVSPVGPLDQVDASEVERNLVVNLVAPMLLMRRFIRATGRVPLRRIINISSGAGRRPIFGWSAYCAAKAGLDMASRTVAAEAVARGLAIEVTSLAPGVIDTPMQATVRGAPKESFIDVERFVAMKADGTLRPADDVAADILRLEAEGRLRGDPVQDLREIA